MFELLDGSRFTHILRSADSRLVETIRADLEGSFVLRISIATLAEDRFEGTVHSIELRSEAPERTYEIRESGYSVFSQRGGIAFMFLELDIIPIRDEVTAWHEGFFLNEGFPRIAGIALDAFPGLRPDEPIRDTFYFTIHATPRAEDAVRFFRRGDINADGQRDISDPIALLRHLFADGPEPRCPDAADADDDGVVELTDAVFVLEHLFLQGGRPAPPFLQCGLDPTPDDLGCGGQPPCMGQG